MSLRTALVYALNANAPLAALVGAQIYPGVVPEDGLLPAVTWQIISIPRDNPRSLGGRNGTPPARVQLSAVSKLLADCDAIASALRAGLDAFTGPLAPGFTVVETILKDEKDFFGDLGDGTGRVVFRTVLDFLIRYREAPPRPNLI